MEILIRDSKSGFLKAILSDADAPIVAISIANGEFPTHEVPSKNQNKKIYISDTDMTFCDKRTGTKIFIWKDDKVIIEN